MMGGLYRISEWIMRLSVINVLWIICSIPVVFLVLMGMTSTLEGAFVSFLPLIAILTPFTVFPATAAMYAVARKWVTGEEDVPLLKTFFRGYKENYLQSMIGGIVFILIFVLIYVNYRFYLGQGKSILQILSVIFIAFTVVMMAAIFNFFSIMVHLHMKIGQIIKNAVLITIGSPINSVVLIICNGVIFYISIAKFTFLIPFFMGSISATFSFWQFHRSFQKIQTKQQQLEERERENAVNNEDNESGNTAIEGNVEQKADLEATHTNHFDLNGQTKDKD
jgi:uncharacterized membrane protein YesL